MKMTWKKLTMLWLLCFCFLFSVKANTQAASPVTSAKKVTGGTLEKSKSLIRYKYSDGTYAEEVWLNINGSVYYFNEKGRAATGLFTYGDAKYYANSKGVIYRNKWMTKKKKQYFFQTSGRMAVKSFVKYQNNYYYVNAKGIKQKNKFITINNTKYYVNKDGVRLQSEWLKKSGKYYYFEENGAMAVSKWVGDFYVDANGARVMSGTIDGYVLGVNGERGLIKATKEYCFLGDSRMVGMQAIASDSKVNYIAKVSMGYSWLKSTAEPALNSYLKKKPDATVVLAFGVNDMGNINSYIEAYKKLITSYPKATFYVLSVNPINDSIARSHGYLVKNSQVTAFNKKLKAAFSTCYIDSYSYLKKNGYSTADGIHYQNSTYKTLFNFIMEKTADKTE